jgi:hypothetical protein
MSEERHIVYCVEVSKLDTGSSEHLFGATQLTNASNLLLELQMDGSYAAFETIEPAADRFTIKKDVWVTVLTFAICENVFSNVLFTAMSTTPSNESSTATTPAEVVLEPPPQEMKFPNK